ncbi:MAG: hypothetical protein MI861_24440, partial [Pirellulales bacterium]|nr:hypothetical protein [Pirellulales bacterium]
PAVETLRMLAAQPSTAVQSGALKRLFEIDPGLVDQFADQAIESPDVNVRRIAAQAMIWTRKAERIAPLCKLIDDVNPSLRIEVADALVDLAQDEGLRDEVILQSMAVLDTGAWRGCEQAVIVLVNLDHNAAGNRFVDLLNHPRGEVMIASAWGLRRLELDEHLPAMLEQAKQVYRGFRRGRLSILKRGPEEQIAQLFIAFGKMRYRQADPLMRVYLPKNLKLGDNARSAAVWALGQLYESKAPADLTSILVQRLNDVSAEEPETSPVRHQCALSLGRMESHSAIPDLRKYASATYGKVGLACQWSLQKLTGEALPPLPVQQVDYQDWFLMPAR